MDKTEATTIKIWNPLHAVFWSFLLTPVFGAYIYLKNWESLKNDKMIKAANYWFYTSIVVLALLLTKKEAAEGLFVIFFIAWIFVPARKQINYVKNLEPNITNKVWTKPILTSIGIILVIALIFETGLGTVGSPGSNYKLTKQDKMIIDQITNMSPIEASTKGYFITDNTSIGWTADNFGENHQCILSIRSLMNNNKNEFKNRKWDLSITEQNRDVVIGFADAWGGNQQTARLIIGKNTFEATRTNDFFMLKASRKLIKLMNSEKSAEAYFGQPSGFRISNKYELTDFERGFAMTKKVCNQLD